MKPMPMTPEELKSAMFNTRLEVFEKMYELRSATDPQEKRVLNSRIKALQRLHYWQFRQLKRLEERNSPK